MTTVRDAVRELLRGLGMTTVFGSPGALLAPFLTDWPDDLRFVPGLHESVAVAMADGYAQLAGEPALVCLHSGAGDALGGLRTAAANRTPLIVLGGGRPRRPVTTGSGCAASFADATDAVAAARPHVKWSAWPAGAQDVPGALARAWSQAVQPPAGPVFLAVPVDDWGAPAVAGPLPRRPAPAVPHPDVIAAVAGALTAGAAPGLVVGAAVDADRAVSDTVALAERLGAPVWATRNSARCSFPEDHPLFAGFLPADRDGLRATLDRHDFVLVLGATSAGAGVSGLLAGALPLPPIVLVSDEEAALAMVPQARGIRAGAGVTVRALLAATPPAHRVPPPARPRPSRPAPSRPMSAAFVLDTLAGVLPADALIVADAPSHLDALRAYLPIRARHAGFLRAAEDAPGYGIAAAVGAALARPDRRVVAVLGDGSSVHGVQALWTAARYPAGLMFVVLDNGEYASLRLPAEAAGLGKPAGTELGGIDFVALAQGMGCAAHAVYDPAELLPALAAALPTLEPTVLHVFVAREQSGIPAPRTAGDGARGARTRG